MKAIIIGNGEINDYTALKNEVRTECFIICADGGYRHAKNAEIRPDIIIGDFDSASIPKEDIEKCVYPSRKDFTDGEICVEYVCSHGFDELVMFGMTGMRIDHTLSNMLLLFKHKNSRIIDDKNEIYPLTDKLCIKGKKGKTMSVIPVFGNLIGVVEKGTDYPLDNEDLIFGESRGNSNVIKEDLCEITVKSGKGLVIINNGE